MAKPGNPCILGYDDSARGGRTIPLYQKVYDYLLSEIRSGRWAADRNLPSESELSAQFGVSRMTIKQAFDKLAADGLVYRVRGKGSFLSPNPPETVGTTRLIGFAVPGLNSLFTLSLLKAIEGAASRVGLRLVMAQTHASQKTEEEVLSNFESLGVKGIVIRPVKAKFYSEAVLKLVMRRFPLVFIDRFFRNVDIDYVCSDNVGAGKQAVEHLLSLGHRRIGFISHALEGITSVEDRFSGYLEAMGANGIHAEKRWQLVNLEIASEANREPIRAFLKANPDLTALIAINSGLGRLALEAATEAGLAVPADLSLILFDNREPIPVIPTYIQQQEAEMGEAAVGLLKELMDNPGQARKRLVFPTILVAGQTTAPPRSD